MSRRKTTPPTEEEVPPPAATTPPTFDRPASYLAKDPPRCCCIPCCDCCTSCCQYFWRPFLSFATIAWIWFVIACSYRYVFELPFQFVWSFTLIATIGLLTHLLIMKRGSTYRVVSWLNDNPVAWIGWTILSVAFVALSFLDSPLMTAKLRSYAVDFTTSQLWFGVIALSAVMSVKVLYDILSGKPSPFPLYLKLVCVITIGLVIGKAYENSYASYNCMLELNKEYIPAGFTQEYQNMLSEIISTDVAGSTGSVWNTTIKPQAIRSVHPKHHGCVRATFTVAPRLHAQRRHGTFQEGNQYPAWVRFSNGAHRIQPDSTPDIRGMAVKLMGVHGPMLLEEDPLFNGEMQDQIEHHTHDILTISSDTFLVSDPLTYHDFLRAVGADPSNMWPALRYVFPSVNPLKWRLGFVQQLMKLNAEGAAITNPFAHTYYSATPYKLGHAAVKYSFRPCWVNAKRAEMDANSKQGPDYLREAMRRQLNKNQPADLDNGACFEMYVQPQVSPCLDRMEDPTTPWTGPWEHVGTLTIPPQDFLGRDQLNFCERLQFNPWHAPKPHKPLSAINLARKLTYAASAHTRNKVNGVRPEEPTGSEVFTHPQLSSPFIGAGDLTNYEYAPYDVPFTHLPKYIRNFPAWEDFTPEKFKRIGGSVAAAQFSFVKRKDVEKSNLNFTAFTTPDDYIKFLNTPYWDKVAPAVKEHIFPNWKKDSEFARQFLSGVNPAVIQAVKTASDLPSVFSLAPITVDFSTITGPEADKIKQQQAQNPDWQKIKAITGENLYTLIATKRVFMVDHAILQDIQMEQGRLFYAPIILFYLKKTASNRRVFMPLAIQLTRLAPASRNLLFTPPVEAEYDAYAPQNLVWLLAKLHAVSADAQYHEMVSHLATTHLALEPIIIGFHRQLAKDHPVLQLVLPHFYETLAINNLGRNTLLKPTGSDFDAVTACGRMGALQMMDKAYRTWSLKGFAFPAQMKAHGFEEVSKADYDTEKDPLPGYLYRDYGFLVWHSLTKYVRTVLTQVYGTDAKIAADEQLRGLIRELRDPDYGALPGEVPELTTIDIATEFLTNIIFTGAAQHSAVNYGQLVYYAFVPNRPLMMLKPMPFEDLSRVDMKYIMSALPSQEEAEWTIQLARTLSIVEPSGLLDSVKGQTGLFAFQSKFPQAHEAFVKELEEIQALVDKRNNEAHVFYPYLGPKDIMPSISI